MHTEYFDPETSDCALPADAFVREEPEDEEDDEEDEGDDENEEGDDDGYSE